MWHGQKNLPDHSASRVNISKPFITVFPAQKHYCSEFKDKSLTHLKDCCFKDEHIVKKNKKELFVGWGISYNPWPDFFGACHQGCAAFHIFFICLRLILVVKAVLHVICTKKLSETLSMTCESMTHKMFWHVITESVFESLECEHMGKFWLRCVSQGFADSFLWNFSIYFFKYSDVS